MEPKQIVELHTLGILLMNIWNTDIFSSNYYHLQSVRFEWPMQNADFRLKITIAKNMSKSILQIIYSCSVQKTAPKNTTYSRNETILKIDHHAKAIAHAKSSLWVKNYNCKKHVKIHSKNHLQLFCAKNRSKKHQIFEK